MPFELIWSLMTWHPRVAQAVLLERVNGISGAGNPKSKPDSEAGIPKSKSDAHAAGIVFGEVRALRTTRGSPLSLLLLSSTTPAVHATLHLSSH